MANKNLKSIKFPNLPDTYLIPQGTVTEADLEEAEGKKADAIVRSASGEIASYDDGGDLPMKSLKVNIVPKQSGSGDPSPSNVRPISGTDTVGIVKTGRNVCPKFVTTSIATVYEDGKIIVNGTISANQVIEVDLNLKAGTTVMMSANNPVANNNTKFRLLGNGGGYDVGMNLTNANQLWTGTLTQDVQKCRITLLPQTYNNFVIYPQVEIGSTAHAYEPYQGETITKTLPQTVYGGTLDVVSGKLNITHIKKALKDIPKINYTAYSAGYGFYTNLAWITPQMASGRFVNDDKTVCSALPKVDTTDSSKACVQIGASNTLIYFMGITNHVEGVTDIDSFYAWLESANVELTYPLATPTEIDLTSTEVKSLLGDNNVWSDSGTVEVEYRADTSLVINKILEALA